MVKRTTEKIFNFLVEAIEDKLFAGVILLTIGFVSFVYCLILEVYLVLKLCFLIGTFFLVLYGLYLIDTAMMQNDC